MKIINISAYAVAGFAVRICNTDTFAVIDTEFFRIIGRYKPYTVFHIMQMTVKPFFYIAITIIQKVVYKKKGIEIKKETKSKKEIEKEKEKADYNENM